MDKTELLKSNRDELTGLLEKQAFYVWAQELVDTADNDQEFAFIFFDMVNFKLYNANYGYEKGDALLIEIGKIIEEIFKEQLVARFTGDHFVVCTNTLQLIPLITEVKRRVKLIQQNINLELKAGVYVLSGETMDVTRCSDRARMACISIKKKYDVDYKFYDEDLEGSLIRKQFIIDNLDNALENEYIQVYYQPIVRTLTENVCGWEALVRWIDPERGVVYPNEFINVLEEYRLIHKLDCYVLEKVISNISEISRAGRPEAVPVSINLSRLDFEAIDIVPFLEGLIEKYDADPSMYKIEITESVLIENPRFIQGQISRLRKMGIDVWMDDFGSGYSSLNVLKNFEFDLVKIDMEFLRGFDYTDDGKIIIKHLVSMLKNLGFNTLAEGVETKEQKEFLKDLGCEMIQGYLIGRPMPFDESVTAVNNLGYRYENILERKFYNTVGGIDILKQNPLEGTERKLIENSLPLAVGVVRDGIWEFVYANEALKKEIKVYGHESLAVAEEMINDEDWEWAQRKDFWEICRISKEKNIPVSIEFVENGKIITMKTRHITCDEESGSDAYLVSIRALTNRRSDSYDKKTSIISNYLFAFYECIDVFGLDGGHFENIYLSNSRMHVETECTNSKQVIRELAEQRVHEDDRKLFLDFMNIDTAKERLSVEKNGVKIGFFRIRNSSNQYIWKSVTIRVVNYLGKEVLLSCVKEASKEFAHNLDLFVECGDEVLEKAIHPMNKEVESYAFENILSLVPVGVFWKDKNRRFLGANQMFLDYYGLKSVDSILGKTDEDMGWHINPEPFMQDEWSVIRNGKVIKNVSGECIVRGEVRKIVATKRPFVVNGETIGLIGFFNDVTEQLAEKEKLEYLSYTDELTGLSNRRAFEDVVKKYIEQYKADRTDFVMLMIDVDKFKKINDMYGHDFGDEVLKTTASIIRNVTANNSVAFRIGGDEFAILHQYKNETEIRSIKQELRIKFAKIERIAELEIRVRISIGSAVYSKAEDLHQLISNADKEMYNDKNKQKTSTKNV